MQLKNEIYIAIGARRVAIALVALFLGSGGLYFALIWPQQKHVQELQTNIEEISETYIELKSTDLTSVLASLTSELDYLETKSQRIFSRVLSTDEIPSLISRLENEAEHAGLKASSTLEKQQAEDDEEEEEEESARFIGIHLRVAGSFPQIVTFLKAVNGWQDSVLLKDFSIRRIGMKTNQLTGSFRFISIIDNT